MTAQLRSLADQMLSALAYVLDVSTGEFRAETGDHWVTAEVGGRQPLRLPGRGGGGDRLRGLPRRQ